MSMKNGLKNVFMVISIKSSYKTDVMNTNLKRLVNKYNKKLVNYKLNFKKGKD